MVLQKRARQYHSFTRHSRILLHDQLKLAGAARGLQGDHSHAKVLCPPTILIFTFADRWSRIQPCVAEPISSVFTLFRVQHSQIQKLRYESLTKSPTQSLLALSAHKMIGLYLADFRWVLRFTCKLVAFPKEDITLLSEYSLHRNWDHWIFLIPKLNLATDLGDAAADVWLMRSRIALRKKSITYRCVWPGFRNNISTVSDLVRESYNMLMYF